MLFEFLFVVVLVFATLTICVVTINYVVEGWLWSELPKIKFNQFKKFYVINSNRWGLGSGCVSCRTIQGEKVALRFGYLDYYRYELWHRNIIKNKFNQEATKQMSEVIAAVKQDVAASEAKAKQMQEEFLKTLKYTYENIPDDNLMELVEEYNKLYGQHYKR